MHAGTAGAGAPLPAVIAIDGPTASGKGTIAQRVAERLGWHYLDSGALYRLAALRALRAGLPLDVPDAAVLAALAGGMAPVFEGGRIRTHPIMKAIYPQLIELGVVTATRPVAIPPGKSATASSARRGTSPANADSGEATST